MLYPQQLIENLFAHITTSISCHATASVPAIANSPAGAAAVSDTFTKAVTTESLVTDLALILVLGAISTLLFKKLRQPVVLGYIVAGFLASPHFGLLPSVASEGNIEFWAQIGIIVLLFSLGLEFSFRKLVNVGGSAITTALVIVAGMMTLGYITGRLLNFGNIDSIFLGGMLSMSSTTIIIKAFSDLKMQQKKFVPIVFGVLICEDLFAVVMMVMLSSLALNNSVSGGQMLASVLKLSFFLVIWFAVGVFLLPTFFRKISKSVNQEMLLIIAMSLCFLMVVFSLKSGFSMALGAFVMGSILAGTIHAEKIETVVQPVKDLFGAVFFISVGMMVNPAIIREYSITIITLSLVVIAGMIVFGTIGMLITGKQLKTAIQSSFSLTQIGEFAFIIASLGMTLGVLDTHIYPIIVAVSVITTFLTPYFIKAAEPCYALLEKILPERLLLLLNRYSKQEAESESQALWKAVMLRYSWRVILYTAFSFAIIMLSGKYLQPLLTAWAGRGMGRLLFTVLTLAALSPLLLALASPELKREEFDKLSHNSSRRSDVPLVVMLAVRMLIACTIVIFFIHSVYSRWTVLLAVLCVTLLIIAVFYRKIRRQMHNVETRFLSNLNERELHRSGKENNLISDLHLAHITVGYDCPFAGERLRDSDIRKRYGVNVASITRGSKYLAVPDGNTRVFPGDQLAVVGTDEQIQELLPIVENNDTDSNQEYRGADTEFLHISLSATSPLLGKTVATARIREDYAILLVAIQRGEQYIKPTGIEVFADGDTLWAVGNMAKLRSLK